MNPHGVKEMDRIETMLQLDGPEAAKGADRSQQGCVNLTRGKTRSFRCRPAGIVGSDYEGLHSREWLCRIPPVGAGKTPPKRGVISIRLVLVSIAGNSEFLVRPDLNGEIGMREHEIQPAQQRYKYKS